MVVSLGGQPYLCENYRQDIERTVNPPYLWRGFNSGKDRFSGENGFLVFILSDSFVGTWIECFYNVAGQNRGLVDGFRDVHAEVLQAGKQLIQAVDKWERSYSLEVAGLQSFLCRPLAILCG